MTDHNLLTAELPYRALDMIPPPESVETSQPNARKGANRVKLPLSPRVVSRQRKRLMEARGHLAQAARTRPELDTLPEAVRTRISQVQEANPTISPWMQHGAPDPFKLTTPAVAAREAGQEVTLHQRMADQHAFRACLKTLAHGKAPGPDGVVNEVLQILPESGVRAMHLLMQIMWATGHTPDDGRLLRGL